jgi:hypothetical protein
MPHHCPQYPDLIRLEPNEVRVLQHGNIAIKVIQIRVRSSPASVVFEGPNAFEETGNNTIPASLEWTSTYPKIFDMDVDSLYIRLIEQKYYELTAQQLTLVDPTK